MVRWPSGRRRTPGKCVYGNVSRVRIPPSPPLFLKKPSQKHARFFLFLAHGREHLVAAKLLPFKRIASSTRKDIRFHPSPLLILKKPSQKHARLFCFWLTVASIRSQQSCFRSNQLRVILAKTFVFTPHRH